MHHIVMKPQSVTAVSIESTRLGTSIGGAADINRIYVCSPIESNFYRGTFSIKS